MVLSVGASMGESWAWADFLDPNTLGTPEFNTGPAQIIFYFFFLIQFYVPFKIISAHMRRANQ